MNPDAYIEMAETEARHWWFVGRRAVLTSIIGRLHLPGRARILEVGAGTGGNLPMLATFGSVCALEMDASARRIAEEKTGGRFDIRAGTCPGDIPFAGPFDLICLLDVLEHIDDDVGTLQALRPLLAPQARVLVTVPAHQWLWSAHDAFLHHKRRYGAVELRGKAATAGLRAERLSYCNTVLFPAAVAVRLHDRLTRRKQASGREVPPDPVNALLARAFSAEAWMLDRFDLPFGVSLVGVFRASPDD